MLKHFILTLLLARFAFAGGGPENVVVVVNEDSDASKAIADEYVRLRNIPPINVISLRDLPNIEQVDIDTFRDKILQPVLDAIDKRGLKPQIDYVAYSADFPWAIDARNDVKGTKLPRALTPTGSLNGLTYLYQRVLAKDGSYLQLNSNRYMRRPIRSVNRKPVEPDDQKRYAEAAAELKQEKWTEAAAILATLTKKYPQQAGLHYNLACCLARQDKLDEAMTSLSAAVDSGWFNRKHTEADEDLTALREREDFKKLLDKMDERRNAPFQVQPTHAFHAQTQWNPQGDVVDEGGEKYLLSTMLAVTSGRGNTVEESIESLRRSVRADASQPDGTIYYMVNGNIRSKTREPAFLSAVTALKKLNIKAEINDGILPKEKADVAGAMIGTASFNWDASKSKIMPGAICEHLTSFGGVMREGAGQTPLTEFLRHGAAGASGTVTEPLAIQNKFPFAFLHVHYARGCSLAEAFYQSVYCPYQLLIVADPLCQPWAKPVKVVVEGVTDGNKISGEIAISPKTEGQEDSVQRFELFVDGIRKQTCQPGKQLVLDSENLANGSHELRIISIGSSAIEFQNRAIVSIVVDNSE